MSKSTTKIALTMGDPKGVGPEIVAMVASKFAADHPPVTIFGNASILNEAAQLCQLSSPSHWNCTIVEVADTPTQGHISQQCVARAVEFCMKETAALVTAPINKHRWKTGHGHTEYLAALTQAPIVGMMMAGPRLRTVPVTIHVPLSKISQQLTAEKIIAQAELTHHFLKNNFNISAPKIAVTGLNPHAGEQGDLGNEEITIIGPAIEALRAKGITVTGPFPADGLFSKFGGTSAPFDAVICMYHDQALIPAKMLDYRNTVNVTMGLPFVRTSPDHGTAEDIAWHGKADAHHLRAAIDMAITLTRSTQ